MLTHVAWAPEVVSEGEVSNAQLLIIPPSAPSVPRVHVAAETIKGAYKALVGVLGADGLAVAVFLIPSSPAVR